MGIHLCQSGLNGSTVDRFFCPLPNAIMSSKRSEKPWREQTATTNSAKARINLGPEDTEKCGESRGLFEITWQVVIQFLPFPGYQHSASSLMPAHQKSQKSMLSIIEATASETPGKFLTPLLALFPMKLSRS